MYDDKKLRAGGTRGPSRLQTGRIFASENTVGLKRTAFSCHRRVRKMHSPTVEPRAMIPDITPLILPPDLDGMIPNKRPGCVEHSGIDIHPDPKHGLLRIAGTLVSPLAQRLPARRLGLILPPQDSGSAATHRVSPLRAGTESRSGSRSTPKSKRFASQPVGMGGDEKRNPTKKKAAENVLWVQARGPAMCSQAAVVHIMMTTQFSPGYL